MKPILALRHVPHEGLGLLERVFREQRVVYRVMDLPAGAPRSLHASQLAGLVVLGGSMNADDIANHPFLADEIKWIRQAVSEEVPVLGICLGSQLLAKALGGRVYPNSVKEIGWYPIELTEEGAEDTLFFDSSPTERVFQWHGDTFDLPEGAVLLARGNGCPHQAFRYGPTAYGLQFHIEVTEPMIEEWLGEPGNCGELAGLDYIDPQRIREQTPASMPSLLDMGERILGRWVEMCKART